MTLIYPILLPELVQYMTEQDIPLFPHTDVHLTVASTQHPYETLGHTTSLHSVLVSYR